MEKAKAEGVFHRRLFQVLYVTVLLTLFCIMGAMAQEEGTGLVSSGQASRASWLSHIRKDHKNVFVAIVVFSGFFYLFLIRGRKGQRLYLRTIPGVKAIEEAIGRATEMGKPVLYVPGLDDIDEIQTLASLNILPYVAEMTAEYGAPLIVPTRRSVVMSVCEEIIKEAHLKAGKPETFNLQNIRYLSDEQFAYTAAIDGIMLREKPAANLYIGAFYAESLILSETGFLSGSIQIAGTASAAQLPFFIAACDYTLIGEEFYAASAYLSDELSIKSSVKAADYLKIVILGALLLGVISATFGFSGIVRFIKSWL